MTVTAEDDLIWIALEDFTPGIITNSQYAAGVGNPVPGNQPGQAQSAVGCIALPNGGLTPLPSLGETISPNNIPSGTQLMTVGLFLMGPILSNITGPPDAIVDGVIYGIIGYDGTTWDWALEKIEAGPDTGIRRVTLASDTGADQGMFGGNAVATMTGGMTLFPKNLVTDPVGSLFISWWVNTLGGNTDFIGQGYQWLYPDPQNPATVTPYTLTTPLDAVIGEGVTHQGRCVVFQYLIWQYGNGSPQYPVNSWSKTNEYYDYTDPAQSLTFGNQQETFVPEAPYGAGAWGTLDASELFVVKHLGGAYIISGDLNNPVVTRVPSVTSTYGLESRAAVTPIGVVYASNGRGLWAWNGGSASQKISNALNDDFMVCTDLALSITPPVYFGPTVDICAWGEWIVTTNDWVYDTNLGGWWKLPPPSTGTGHLWVQPNYAGDRLYASPCNPTSDCIVDVYLRTVPVNTYTWKSYPLRQGNKTANHPMAIREVIVRAQGDGTVTIALTGVGGLTAQGSPSLVFTVDDETQPLMQRAVVGAESVAGALICQDVIVEITSTAALDTDPAPVVYSVTIGYEELPQPLNRT